MSKNGIFTWREIKDGDYLYQIPCIVFKDSGGEDIRELNLYQGIDPAPGTKKSSGDYFVDMVIGIDSDFIVYVLEYVRKRIEVDSQAKSIVDMYVRYNQEIKRTTIETTAYQESLRTVARLEMKKRNLHIPGLESGVKPRKSKSSRHDKIVGLVKTGKLYLTGDMDALKTELLTVHGTKSSPDCLDALWNALYNAAPYRGNRLKNAKETKEGYFVMEDYNEVADKDLWKII